MDAYYQAIAYQDSQLSGCAQSARYHGRRLSSDSPMTAGALRVLGVAMNATNEPWNTPAWRKLRRSIIARDKHQCQAACASTLHVTVHHIIHRDEGGSDDPANLITLCAACHNEIEVSEIRFIEGIRAFDAAWHASVSWWPTQEEPQPRICKAVPVVVHKSKFNHERQLPQGRPMRPPTMRICPSCGREFAHPRMNKIVCNSQCKARISTFLWHMKNPGRKVSRAVLEWAKGSPLVQSTYNAQDGHQDKWSA
jgi:hypothetical protein